MLRIHNLRDDEPLVRVQGAEGCATGWLRPARRRAVAQVRQFRYEHAVGIRRAMRSVIGFACFALFSAALVLILGFHYIYFDRSSLPDIEPFLNFDFAAIGRVYDVNGLPLIELAKEHRQIMPYADIPPVVRDAVLAAEDKNFFSHSGVDYASIPRVLNSVRLGTLLTRIERMGRKDKSDSLALFRQGGSTISQQLVRAYFLRGLTDRENSNDLRPGLLSFVIGARSAKKFARKVEEIRLSVWMEQAMQERFGSKQRAKEEILARYVSFLYMGDGQYGFAAASEHYFGQPLNGMTVTDADKAALLAGIAKSPRVYAPNAADIERVLHRRNQILDLMAKRGFISQGEAQAAEQLPLKLIAPVKNEAIPQVPAVLASVRGELASRETDLSFANLLLGRIKVLSTVDSRTQQIVGLSLEHGLAMYEKRHPGAIGKIQGSVVVLRNRDAAILAESGGRQLYNERSSAYGDFNRATKSLRQPGSAMKPFVYLAAFRDGRFNLKSMVPDEPISVPDQGQQKAKSISNYDGKFKGMIPLREALAESRNAVAIWITTQIGIGNVIHTAHGFGVRTDLRPFVTTALGASEVNLLELANGYRMMASGIIAEPHVIGKILRESGEVAWQSDPGTPNASVTDDALLLIQEGLRGVIRLPTGTAHALDSSEFPVAVMGKTGTTSNFRDGLFVGSTYGPEGITVAVRLGFDDGRSLGKNETGGRVALPIFREIMLAVYREKLVGPPPVFPPDMEGRINAYLKPPPVVVPEPKPEVALVVAPRRWVIDQR